MLKWSLVKIVVRVNNAHYNVLNISLIIGLEIDKPPITFNFQKINAQTGHSF